MRGGGLLIDARLGRHGGEVAVGEILEQRAAQAADRTVLAGTVEGDVEAHVLLQEQVQRGVEVVGVAQVTDDLAPVDVGLEEAQLHAVQRRQHRQRTVVHHLGRLGLEDAVAVVLAVLQVRDHEMRHVLAAGGERAGRRGTDDLIRPRLLGGQPDSPWTSSGTSSAGSGCRKLECFMSSGARMCFSM